MGSVVDDSLGSVGMDFSLLQGQLLQADHLSSDARPGPEAADPTPQRDSDSQHAEHIDGDGNGNGNIFVASDADTDKHTNAAPKPPTPRLATSNSAPTGELQAMAEQATLQAPASMPRAVSYHGLEEFGDMSQTQADSQMWRTYSDSLSKSSHVNTTPKKPVLSYNGIVSPNQGTYDTTYTGKTPQQVSHVEEVDLVGAYPKGSSPAHSTTSEMEEELLESPITQFQTSDTAHANGFPQTPSLAGSKRRRSGEILTSAPNTTKGLSQFDFGAKVPTVTATQLFNQTQAPSSPMLDAPRSDPVLTRPSPNLHNPVHFSSPGMISSSPLLTRTLPSTSEPRDTYISKRESQERRARREIAHLRRSSTGAIMEEDGESEDEDTQQRRMEVKRMQKLMSEQAMEGLGTLRAPSRPGSRPTSSRKKHTTIDLVTPATMRKNVNFADDISEDGQETDDEEQQPELPIEVEDAHDGEAVPDDEEAPNDDDNDVYDEFSQTVMRSQRGPEDDEERQSGQEEDVEPQDGDEMANEDPPHHFDDAMEDGQELDEYQPQKAVNCTQHSAIADSQPERQELQRSLLSKETTGQPNPSSIVPGSQYAGATSQEIARHAARIPDSTNISAPPADGSSKDQTTESKIPSSPPLPVASGSIAENSADASVARRDLLAAFRADAALGKNTSDQQLEIPESDIADQNNTDATTATSIFETAAESNQMPFFSTAQTHHSESNPSPGKPRLLKQSSKMSASQQSSVPTPLKAAGVRRFADIARDQSPPCASGDSVDVDAIMGGVFTEDDQTFTDLLSSPQREKARAPKRRRMMQSRSESKSSRQPSRALEEPVPQNEDEPVSSPGKQVDAGDKSSVSPAETTVPDAKILPVPAVEALRDSPSKINELPSATPEEASAPGTPESTRRREKAGAHAVSQLLARRSTRPAKTTKLSGTGRKTAASRGRQTAPTAPSKVKNAKRMGMRTVVHDDDEDDLAEAPRVPEVFVDDQGQTDQPDTIIAAAGHAAAAAEEPSSDGLPVVAAPTRVFALFRGTHYNAYYPATWLSSSADGQTHRVRFDDTTILSLGTKDVRALDLRVGDAIKVDYEGFKTKTWLVTGYGRLPASDEDRENGTDIYDHVTIKIQAKASQRNSLPANGSNGQGEGEVKEALVSNVKITHTQYPQYDDRVFTPPTNGTPADARVATPAASEHSTSIETPTSRPRRPLVPNAKVAGVQTSRLRETSVASSTEISSTGMFEGMAFAISYASNESEKAEVTRLIHQHGGTILEQGFDELFIPPQLDEPPSPSKRTPKPLFAATANSLQLKPEYQSIGFVAVIADRHSRRAKYMQALSLGLPTISGRWIIDSLDSSRNTSLTSAEPRSWTRYLLASGDSAYLGGVACSRSIVPYSATSAKLVDTVANREKLLAGSGVLLVAPKKGKGTWERRKAYAFLTLALGAGSVKRVSDLAQARALLTEEPETWAWVYVDEEVGEAAKALFGKGVGKKRKREEGAAGRNAVKEMMAQSPDGGVRVVNDEFVVQSLILGALVD